MGKVLGLFSFLLTAVLFFAGCQSNVVGPVNHNSAATSLSKAAVQSFSGSGYANIFNRPYFASFSLSISANKYNDGSVDDSVAGTFSYDAGKIILVGM